MKTRAELTSLRTVLNNCSIAVQRLISSKTGDDIYVVIVDLGNILDSNQERYATGVYRKRWYKEKEALTQIHAKVYESFNDVVYYLSELEIGIDHRKNWMSR